MNKTKSNLKEAIDNIFFDLQLDIHEALKTYEKDWILLSTDIKEKLKK